MGAFSCSATGKWHQTRKPTQHGCFFPPHGVQKAPNMEMHPWWVIFSKLRWGVSNTKNTPIWARFSCLASWRGVVSVPCHWWWWRLFGGPGGRELLNLAVWSSTSTWLLHMDVELQTTKFPSTHSQPPLPWQHQRRPSQKARQQRQQRHEWASGVQGTPPPPFFFLFINYPLRLWHG